MSKVNGEKARAAIEKHRRTARRVKSRAQRSQAVTASPQQTSAKEYQL